MKKLILLLMVLCATNAFALPGTKQYRAVWSPNTEADLASYSLYWRVPGGSFSDTNKIAGITATVQLLSGIVPDNVEIALTATDKTGNESAFSETVPFSQDGISPAVPSGLIIEQVE